MNSRLWRLFRASYPYAVALAVGAPLAAGDFALFIVAMAGAIALLPAAYGPDVDEIVERTFDPDRR